MIKPELRFWYGWNHPGRYPPEHDEISVEPFEPFLPLAHDLGMVRPVNELFERFYGFPNRHVDEDRIVIVRTNGSGVAGFGLEAPNKTGSGIGKCINGFELGYKAGHERVGHRGTDTTDIELG